MNAKVIYSTHAIDPRELEDDNFPFYLGARAPDDVSLLVQKTYLASILRMQTKLTQGLVESLNYYTKRGEFYFDELEVVDLEKEILICTELLKCVLDPEDFCLIEPDSIRVVMEDLVIMVRRQVMNCFAEIFNNLNNEVSKHMAEKALITSQCIITFANILTKEKREIN